MRAQMLAGGALGPHHREQNEDRPSVDGIEGHSLRTDEQGGQLPHHVLESTMGNGDPVANPRRLQGLSLAEHAVEVGPIGRRKSDPEQVRQCLQGVVFGSYFFGACHPNSIS